MSVQDEIKGLPPLYKKIKSIIQNVDNRVTVAEASIAAVEIPVANPVTVGTGGDYALMDEAVAAGETNIYLLPGTHPFENGMIVSENTHIRGAGSDVTFLIGNAATNDMFKPQAAAPAEQPSVGTYVRTGNHIVGTASQFVTDGLAVGDYVRIGTNKYSGAARILELDETNLYLDDFNTLMAASGNCVDIDKVFAPYLYISDITIDPNTRYVFAANATNYYIPVTKNVNMLNTAGELQSDGDAGLRWYAENCNFAGTEGWAFYGAPGGGMFINCSIGLFWMGATYMPNNTFVGCYIHDINAITANRPDIVFLDCLFGQAITDVDMLEHPANGGCMVIGCRDINGYIEQRPPYYTVAALPTPSAHNTGRIAWCTNGQAGAPCGVICNGTNWVYLSDNLTVASAT